MRIRYWSSDVCSAYLVDLGDVSRVDLDQGQVVVGAGVLVGLAALLHGQPRGVGEGAAADAGAGGDQRAALDEVDLGAEREGRGVAAVGVGRDGGEDRTSVVGGRRGSIRGEPGG